MISSTTFQHRVPLFPDEFPESSSPGHQPSHAQMMDVRVREGSFQDLHLTGTNFVCGSCIIKPHLTRTCRASERALSEFYYIPGHAFSER
jgi:hypothetical protein